MLNKAMLYTVKQARCFLLFGLAFVSMMLSGYSYAIGNQTDYRYVINIHYSNKLKATHLGKFAKKYLIYNLKLRYGSQIKYRTRLGFFESRKKALDVLSMVKRKYPDAWLDTAKKYDYSHQEKWYARTVAGSINKTTKSAFIMTRKETEQTMEKARRFVVENNFKQAIKLYTRVISRGHTDYRQDAQEFLGVSREKNGQYAHAKAEYREYLRQYPKGEGAERVKMRLDNILLVRAKPRRKLDKTRSDDRVIWSNYGYLTEFYQYDKYKENGINSEKSSSTTSLGLFTRRRSDTSDLKMQMTGDYLHDFDDSDDNRERLTSLYIDYANRPKTTSVRLGRQNHSRSGVLGRMDGVWADYQFHPQWRLNLVAGYPVNIYETNRIQTHRQFYGYSLDIGPFDQYWDFNIFRLEQEVDGMADREASGGEIRYISPKRIFFSLVDYDTYYDELNKLYVVTTLRFNGRSTLNLIYDKGKSPYLQTTNALLGQPYQSIEEMRKVYKKSEIRQIAKDRTADVTTSTISGTVPMAKDFLLNLDFTVSNVSGTPESANVAGTESTGDEYYYGIQVIGNDILLKNDTLYFGMRFLDSNSYKRDLYSIGERMMLGKKWRVNLDLYYKQSKKNNGAETTEIKPGAGFDYIYSKSLRLEADLRYYTAPTSGDTLTKDSEGLSITAGMIYDF